MLQNKKILLGVSGGIAAYKSAFLVRLLVKAGADVKVIMTPAATEFIGPITLATLSKNKVVTEFTQEHGTSWNNHVELAVWCDLMLIAPATSNTIAKMAHGLCDNILLACYLSAKSPVFIAPAMDLDMAEHPSLMKNLTSLENYGVNIIPYEEGELASGLNGKGRMAEVEHIVEHLKSYFESAHDFAGKSFLINAGPTHEAIDPVRFIGNKSTGKMGVAIANSIAERGGAVTLVLGPTEYPHQIASNIKLKHVQSAKQMFEVCSMIFPRTNVAILTAAVADYAPSEISDQKIKKSSNNLSINLVKTPDTLAKLGEIKTSEQLLIGFALETENELEHAKEKLTRKNLDMIILNSLNDKHAGFGFDTNKITAIKKSGEVCKFDLKKKSEVANDISNLIKTLLHS